MSKASEDLLGKLHGAVAKVLTEQVQLQEEVQELDIDGIPQGTGELMYSASPATLATAIKFLKDNNITADAELDENMNGLADALAKKQKRSRLADAASAAKDVH